MTLDLEKEALFGETSELRFYFMLGNLRRRILKRPTE